MAYYLLPFVGVALAQWAVTWLAFFKIVSEPGEGPELWEALAFPFAVFLLMGAMCYPPVVLIVAAAALCSRSAV